MYILYNNACWNSTLLMECSNVSKHAGSDPEVFRLRPVMANTASVQPESGRIVYAGSDFPHPFQLRFSKEGVDHLVQNRPGSDLDGLVRVWPNASGLEASWCAGIIGLGFWQEPTARNQFPTFRLGFAHPQKTRMIRWKTSPGPIEFWLIVSGFGQTDPVRKQAGVEESSGPLLAS